ncbi:hypothetical protein RchiOBHm_Chr7g0240001 [Rosa chinensis]|uniref:Uncharacterized protein n=1 Tax=Rosa chinensis TaxID=74649 RepID=A0A2P6PHV5_ROSCH|nr:hypothetical protein RchiOBHm_Chr7g0240001 [Rosa chinensis]
MDSPLVEFEEDNDTFADKQPRPSLEVDDDDDLDSSKVKSDKSALEARNGKDIQGIPWERLNFTRDKYCCMRVLASGEGEKFL